MALPRNNRMTKQDFTSKFRSGKRIRGEALSLQYGPAEKILIAVVIQAKAITGAVDRNRIRRQLSAVLERHIEIFRKPVWVAVIVHARPKSIVALKDELSVLLGKSGII